MCPKVTIIIIIKLLSSTNLDMFLTTFELFRQDQTSFSKYNSTESVLLMKGKILQCILYGKYHILLI